MTTQDDPRHRVDVVSSGDLVRLAATLDAPRPSAGVPPLWHWTSFLERSPSASLGPDGHPRAGGLVADPPFPRRMFAGGRISWHAPFPADREVVRTAETSDIVRKEGSNGPLAFVTVTLTYRADGEVLAIEHQDLVYLPDRDPSAPAAAPQAPRPAPPDEVAPRLSETVTFGEVELFRFSALTFNAHRIHYDLPYATSVEGYPGTVVHGPLLIVRLLELVRTAHGDEAVAELSFRAKAPAFCGQSVEFAGWDDGKDEQGRHRLRLEARRERNTLMSATVVLREGRG